MHCCIPDRSFQDFPKRLISSSWLSSSLPFYSPLELLKYSAGLTGGARIQFTSIDIDAELVKRKVNHEEKKVN